MPDWAIFPVAASIAGVLRCGDLSAAAAGAAKVLPFILLVPFLVARGVRVAQGRGPR